MKICDINTNTLNPKKWTSTEYIFVAILIYGIVIRLTHITKELDPDEVFTVHITGKHFLQMIEASIKDRPHPPLYNILLWAWQRVIGTDEAHLRAMNIALYAIFIYASYTFLKKNCTPLQTLLSILLLSCSPFFIFYTTEIRPYALIAPLSSLHLLAYSHINNNPTRQNYLLWAISCALLIYTQYLAAIPIMILATVYLYSRKDCTKNIILYTFIGITPILPWLHASFWTKIIRNRELFHHINWIHIPTIKDILLYFGSILHSGQHNTELFFEFTNIHSNLAYNIAATCVIILAISNVLFSNKDKIHDKITMPLMATAAIPPVLYFAASHVFTKSIFIPRQLLYSAITTAMALPLGIPRSRSTTRIIAVVTICTYCAASSLTYCFHNINSKHKEIAAFIATRYPDIPIVTEDSWNHRLPILYYINKEIYFENSHPENIQSDFIYICENNKCSYLESNQNKITSKLIKSTSWGINKRRITLNAYLISQKQGSP